SAKEFEMPYVGFSGDRSGGYLAMRILRRSLAADEAFNELVRSGTTAGQLYGLAGLYDTDPLAFRVALPRYRTSIDNVRMFWGCVISDERVSELACSKIGVRIRGRESLDQWWRREGSAQRGPLDICGGGIPRVFS